MYPPAPTYPLMPNSPSPLPPLNPSSVVPEPIDQYPPAPMSPPSATDLLTETPPDKDSLEPINDTSLETVAASMPSMPSVSDPPVEVSPVSSPEPPATNNLQDLVLDVMRAIESSQDSAATMGITQLVKNGHLTEALSLYQSLAIKRATNKNPV